MAEFPFERGDRLTGHYWCAQGRTEATLLIEDIGEDAFDAIFEFSFPGSATYDPAEGSYRVRGTYDARSRKLKLVHDRWLEQPVGYNMVDFAGEVGRAGGVTGTISGAPGCSTFTLSPDRAKDKAAR